MSESIEQKRTKKPEKWKQNIRKRLRQSGQEYLSVTGKVINKKEVQPGCGDTCYLQCIKKITQNQRQDIHSKFWKLREEQRNYFYWKYTARAQPKKRRRETPIEDTRRDYTFKYRFELNGELIYVCSKFFFATLDISPRRIYYFYKHCYDEEICMPKTNALFGRGLKRVPDLAERLSELRAHINAFPTECKNGNDKKLYLERGLDLNTMYNMYVESVSAPLKQHWYNKVFHKEFNLAFQAPANIKIVDANETSDVTFIIQEIQPANAVPPEKKGSNDSKIRNML